MIQSIKKGDNTMHKTKKKYFIIGGTFLFILTLFCWLQFWREIDVYSSYTISSKEQKEEHITFMVNRLYVPDKKKCAMEIIEKCRKNNFQSVLFSYDLQKPTALYGTVYRSHWEMQRQKVLFTFRYTQKDKTQGIYNYIDNPEKFILEME